MKRSEMVDILATEIRYAERGDISFEEKASLILKKLEYAGMLPPDAMPPALSLGERETKDAIWARTRFRWEIENEQ
jgi:hypothetical protein